LQPFLARYPDVSLNIVPQESPLLEEWLSAQRHDLGLTETVSTPAGTERTPLLTFNEVCVLPQNHRLAHKAQLTPGIFRVRITSACRVPTAIGNYWMLCSVNIR
jgi:DNA-binding transcriptional LysR family regulator